MIAVSRTYARTASGVSTDGPGIPLDGAPVAERVRRADPPAQVDGRDEALEVGFAREDVRVERDRILGRRTGEAQRAAAERAHDPAHGA